MPARLTAIVALLLGRIDDQRPQFHARIAPMHQTAASHQCPLLCEAGIGVAEFQEITGVVEMVDKL